MTKSIHDKALEIALKFKQSEIELISVIQEIDEKKAFYEKQCASTYDYCVRFLKLSDNLSLDFIAVARKAKTVPELKQALQKNLITVSKARRITSVITRQNSHHWLKLAQTLSKDKLQKEIAKVNPQVLTPEKTKYVTENRLKLELGVSEEFMKALKRVQELLSQKSKTHINFELALGCVIKEFLDREDPLNKAQRAKKRELKKKLEKGSEEKSEKELEKETGLGEGFKKIEQVQEDRVQEVYGPGHIKWLPVKNGPQLLTHIPASIHKDLVKNRGTLKALLKHQLNLRDQAQCTYRDHRGTRCLERKWLHFHHLLEVSKGGRDELKNLTTLCSGHHRLIHLKKDI